MGNITKIAIATLFTCALSLPAARAQEQEFLKQQIQDDEEQVLTDSVAPFKQQISAGVLIGTAGFGLQGTATLSKSWGIRAGFQILPGIKITQEDKIGKIDVEHEYKINVANIHVLADYYTPFWNKPGFRVSAGFAAFVTAKADVTSVPMGDHYFGEIPLNDGRMGEVSTKVTRGGIAPYLGVGFLNLYKTKNFHISADLGSYYLLSGADVEMTATGYLEGNERNQEQLKENLKGYRWLPVLQIGLHYSF